MANGETPQERLIDHLLHLLGEAIEARTVELQKELLEKVIAQDAKLLELEQRVTALEGAN